MVRVVPSVMVRYLESRRYTEKSDVYSFGLILFELISGREVVFGDSDGQRQHITHWASTYI